MPTENKREAKLKIILDSSALFVPLQFRIDIFEELKNLLKTNFEPILLPSILRELEIIAQKGTPSMRRKASYALHLAQKCRLFKTDEKFTSPDDAIVEFAGRWKCPVFTNDRMLRRRLRNISVPVIYVRQKSHLEVDGRITPCLNSSR
jgi:rRNA-processing protein FCF1